MPRPEPGKKITTQLGRVVYDRKPKKWRFGDLLRIGKRLNYRFWIMPGVIWLNLLERIFGFEFPDGFGPMPIEHTDSFTIFPINNEKSLSQALGSNVIILVNGDYFDELQGGKTDG
jgi:hypothetical protein